MAAFGGGIVIADWTTPSLWPFSGTAVTSPIVLATGTPGLSAVATDGTLGVWAVGYNGGFWHYALGGLLASGSLPGGSIYIGCATVGGSGFFVNVSGHVYSSGSTAIGIWPTPTATMISSGTTLFGLLAASGIGTMQQGTGVTGLITLPTAITTPSCIALASAGLPLAVAGWKTAPTLSGAVAGAFNDQTDLSVVGVGNGFAVIWTAPAPFSDAWTQTNALTGLANLSNVVWRPDGFQVMAVSSAAAELQMLNYVTGALSLNQTLAVPGAIAVAPASDSLHALVAQSGLASALPIVFSTGAWSTGVAVTGVSGITNIVSFGPSGAVASTASGITYFTLATGTWSITAHINLGFIPSVLTVDQFNVVYAAGSGSVAVCSGATVLGSGSWAGGQATSIVVQEGRVLIAVPSPDNALYIFGQSGPSTWTQMTSAALGLGTPVDLTLSDSTLFVMGAASTTTYGFSGTPFTLTPVLSGAAAQWNGSSWTPTILGIGHSPSACGFDASGNLRVVTTQNTYWVINATGGVNASGQIAEYTGQFPNVPLSVSCMSPFASGMYYGTSLPGVLLTVP